MDQLDLSLHKSNKANQTKDLCDVVFDSFIGLDCSRSGPEYQESFSSQDHDHLFGTPISPGTDEPSGFIPLGYSQLPKLSTKPEPRNLDSLFYSDLYPTLERTARSHSLEGSMAPSDEISSCSSKDTTTDCPPNTTNLADISIRPDPSMAEMAVPACSSHYRTDSWVRRIEASVDKYRVPSNTPQQIPPTPPLAPTASSHWQPTSSVFEHYWGDYSVHSPKFDGHHLRLQADYHQAAAAQASQQELTGNMILQQSPTPPDSRTPSFDDIVFSPNPQSVSTFTSPESDGEVSWDHHAQAAYSYKLDTSPGFNYSAVPTWWAPTHHHNAQLLSQTYPESQTEDPTMYSGSGLNFASHPADFNPNGSSLAWEGHPASNQAEHRGLSTHRSCSVLKLDSEQTKSPISPTCTLNPPKTRESRTPSPACSRRSKTKKTPAGGSRRGKSVTGNRNNGSSKPNPSTGFVNFTPDDSRRILTGVAPSGSSKTKARREKEQADKRRRMSMAAAKAVLDAGGNLESLEKFEREGHFSWDFA